MKLSVLIGRYAVFAGIAIALNLATQNIVLLLLRGEWFAIYLAIAAGNGIGLLAKFVLDKFWIFADRDVSVGRNVKKLLVYSAFGALTTAIFWTTELAFHYAFGTLLMTNVGALLGLIIGYTIKYQLDRRFTFAARNPDDAAA